jgi:replication fork clamp-binding protein CrfC
METKDWRQECERLQAELDVIKLEASEWKEKFERLALWKEQPRLPVRGVTLDCVGVAASSTKGKTSTQTYTTMGHRSGDDFK